MRVFDQLAIGVFTIYLTYYCRKHYSANSTEILLGIRERILTEFFPGVFPPISTSTSTISTSTSTTTTTMFAAPTPVIVVPETMQVPREVVQVFEAHEQAEGAGATVRRSVGTAQLRNFSPFLMLDHFSVENGAGFPDHPHRGQETITYLLTGSLDHADFTGTTGTLHAGDLQFMTAGRGIIHAEMPGPLGATGLQLWVDLPAALKFCEPRYRDLRARDIPTVATGGAAAAAAAGGVRVKVKVISGRSAGVEGVEGLAYTPVWILDVEVGQGGRWGQVLPRGWSALVYVLSGRAVFSGVAVGAFGCVVFATEGDGVEVLVEEGVGEGARFVVIAGMPLEQPVVQHGPFVLNTQEEVRQAVADYRGYRNGFERGEGWESEIGKRMA